MTRTRPRSLSACAALLLALATVLLGAGPASAHAALVGSDPADGATLAQVPGTVSFTFNEDIQDPAYVVVTAAGARVEEGAVRVDGPVVSVDVADAAPAGEWTAAFRVVSTDGHPVTGEVAFTVEAAAVADPTPTASPSPSPSASASPSETAGATGRTTEGAATTSEDPGFLGLHREHLVIGAVLLALAAGLLVVARRRRTG